MASPRQKLLSRLLLGRSPEEQRKFFRTLHAKPSRMRTDPDMRKRITTGGEYEPMSGKDMVRLASQQSQEGEDYIRRKLLEEIIEGSSQKSENDILRLLELMLNPTKPQRISTGRRSELFSDIPGEVPF